MRKLLLPLVLIPLLAFVLPVAPGVVVESVSKDLATGETWTNTMYVQDGDLAMEFADPRSGASGSMVFLSGPGEWIMNDDQNRRYIRMNREDMEKIATQMKAMMERVEQMMQNIPAAQREAIMNAGGGGMPGMGMLAEGGIPTIEIRDMQENATKGGYPARRFDMYVGEKRTQEMWITDWSNVEGAAPVREAMMGFATMMRTFFESMPSSMVGGGGMSGFMDFERGLPIVTYEIGEDGNPSVETTIKSFTPGDVDRAKFGPKPDYDEQEIDFDMGR